MGWDIRVRRSHCPVPWLAPVRDKCQLTSPDVVNDSSSSGIDGIDGLAAVGCCVNETVLILVIY